MGVLVAVSLLGVLCAKIVHTKVTVTKLGNVEGTTLTARNGRPFEAYYGIPYAKPPVGDLRFQPPVPVDKWNDTLDARNIASPCPQLLKGTTTYDGDEDCLHLNVYTPQNATSGDNIPVIVYIFGGSLKYGNTEREGPLFMMERDIIIVMVNFRQGVLGFLSTGDKVVPGNMALKDQTLALRWTKDNIFDFGGDPDRITLQGHSSGAVCVHLHTLSPLSKGLFHRVIIQSGLADSPLNFYDKDTARKMASALAAKVSCTSASSEELLKCLLTREAKELVTVANTLHIWEDQPVVLFRPTAEDKEVENAFLTELPISVRYPSNNESWLIGITTGEGLSYIEGYSDAQSLSTDNPNFLIPLLDGFLWTVKPSHVNYIAKLIKTYFFGDEKISPCTGLVQMLTGIMHGRGMIDVLQKYTGTKYVYLYDYQSKTSRAAEICGKDFGVTHAEELNIMFNVEGEDENPEDYEFGEEMITRWINFAYSGDPGEPFPINTTAFGPWKPMTSSRMEYLHIKKNGSMEADYFRNIYEFWKKIPIYSKYS